MVTRTEAITNLLQKWTHPDLANRYNKNMEVQVLVAQDGGESVEKEFRGKSYRAFTDGVNTWKSYRIPYKANTEPEYDFNKPQSFPLDKYVEGIGMTGWDFINKRSIWAGFDFDSIAGHSDAHDKKLTPEELSRIREKLQALPYVEIRHSTGGNGLHIYVHINDNTVVTNHTEHAAVARAILGRMSAEIGLKLEASVDACGHVLWVWHRKMKHSERSLKLIKSATESITIPPNWKDHLNVVSRRRARTLPGFVEPASSEEQLFSELTGTNIHTPLDSTHTNLLQYLRDRGKYTSWWDSDNHLLVTHTVALKEAFEHFGYRGIFDTISPASDPATQNCFAFPRRHGAWTVRRFTRGVAESNCWSQDSGGWTVCEYNATPTLSIAARAFGGVEDSKGAYQFRTMQDAVRAAGALGVTIDMDERYMSKRAYLLQHKDGRLIAQMDHESLDPPSDYLQSWVCEKKKWQRIFNTDISQQEEIGPADDLFRNVVNQAKETVGFYCNIEGEWILSPRANVIDYLKAQGRNTKEIPLLLGASIAKSWKIVSQPFQPEYPGNRMWNRNSAKFAIVPNPETDNLSYPHWMLVLKHIGAGIDESVAKNPWCKQNRILTGADYLKLWIANLVQKPYDPLPYLFLFGPQNCGKSILHEALELIIDPGVVRADAALTNVGDFNAELEGAVLCVVEEKEFGDNRAGSNRIKDWTTAKKLSIHKKRYTPYMVENTTHWIQCANSQKACPILPGDTRIVVIHVDKLEKEIPKYELLEQLKKEAADFLSEILNIDLPLPYGRLNIPVLETTHKKEVMDSNKNPVEIFIEECYYPVDGHKVEYDEFYFKLLEWLQANRLEEMSKNLVTRNIPTEYQVAVDAKNVRWICNLTGNKNAKPQERIKPRNGYITKV